MRRLLAWGSGARRGAALAVVLLCVVPFHELLVPDLDGPEATDALLRAEAAWEVTMWGALVVALVGLVGALGVRGRAGAAPVDRAASPSGASWLDRLAARSTTSLALLAGALAAALSAAVTVLVYHRLLAGVDEMAEVVHARYLAAGRLAAPLPAGTEAAWAIPNMLVTARGWASQYPPGHLLAWAPFLRVGLGWLAGPLAFAVLVGFLVASLDRLLPAAHRAHGRLAGLLVAVSPFALTIAAENASHLTAGAAGMLALYAALRVAEGARTAGGEGVAGSAAATGAEAGGAGATTSAARAWAAAAGAAVGLMVLARPWTGLVLGPVLTLGIWLERLGFAGTLRVLPFWVAGGLPPAILLFSWDAALSGSPLLLGYEALYGPAHGLGLHADPWSYPYGLREALAYSASDVVQLGAAFLESPVSVVLAGAGYLALVRSLPRGVAVVAAWALLPVAANALYWFHAPRMLFAAAPAWMLLAVLAVAHTLGRAGRVLRAGIVAGVTASVLIALPLAVSRVVSERWDRETLARIAVPAGVRRETENALVFVHAPWEERITSMLQASGMRSDSIQPILRRNDTCALHLYAVARSRGASGSALPVIDPAQTNAAPARVRPALLEGGSRIWRDPAMVWTEGCAREAAADRFGALALAPLLWQGDLPGLESGRPMFVRDLGPERNRAVLDAFPERRAFVLGYAATPGRPTRAPDDGDPGAGPTLMPYDEGMALLWGADAQPPS